MQALRLVGNLVTVGGHIWVRTGISEASSKGRGGFEDSGWYNDVLSV